MKYVFCMFMLTGCYSTTSTPEPRYNQNRDVNHDRIEQPPYRTEDPYVPRTAAPDATDRHHR